MDVVCAQEHGFAGVEFHVVEEEENEEADIVRELGVQSAEEGGEFGGGFRDGRGGGREGFGGGLRGGDEGL